MRLPLSKLLALSWPEAALLFWAGVTVAAVRLGLWTLPFPLMQKRLASLGRARRQNRAVDRDAVCLAVQRVSRLVPEATCLTQALAAQVLLARRGFESVLRIGVARGDGTVGIVKAHAWLEDQRGAVLIGQIDFAPFVRLPPIDGAMPA
jgi:hypothetical protein